jgi:predicted RNA methylase
MTSDSPLWTLFTAIASANDAKILDLLAATPALAYAVSEDGATRASAAEQDLRGIEHYAYAGGTAHSQVGVAVGPASETVRPIA